MRTFTITIAAVLTTCITSLGCGPDGLVADELEASNFKVAYDNLYAIKFFETKRISLGSGSSSSLDIRGDQLRKYSNALYLATDGVAFQLTQDDKTVRVGEIGSVGFSRDAPWMVHKGAMYTVDYDGRQYALIRSSDQQPSTLHMFESFPGSLHPTEQGILFHSDDTLTRLPFLGGTVEAVGTLPDDVKKTVIAPRAVVGTRIEPSATRILVAPLGGSSISLRDFGTLATTDRIHVAWHGAELYVGGGTTLMHFNVSASSATLLDTLELRYEVMALDADATHVYVGIEDTWDVDAVYRLSHDR